MKSTAEADLGQQVRNNAKPLNLVLFGASIVGEHAYRMLQRDHCIVAFSDNDPAKHGTQVAGVPVLPPERLAGHDFDYVVIASRWVDAIRNRLKELGIPPWKVLVFRPSGLLAWPDRPDKHALQGEDRDFVDIWERCALYTMTSFERGLALFRAMRHVLRNNVPGAFVECGVWRGGSSMIAMLTQLKYGKPNRTFYLFDTFAGMTPPSPHDIDLHGKTARELLDVESVDREASKTWAIANLDQVRRNIASTGYDLGRVVFVQGDVAQTLAQAKIERIAMLRLDTDFYDSTLAELKTLYPKLVRNGALLIDDYGHWQGARQATDEYFSRPAFKGAIPYFQRIDYTGRLAIRTDDHVAHWESRDDYAPPGLADPGLLSRFPSLSIADPAISKWPYLRRDSPHNWRVDERNFHDVTTGVLSVEEALLLHNNALPFRGLRALEIGCHLGWSTAHILAAGVSLDVIDPGLGRDDQARWVRESLDCVANPDYRLWAGYSPSLVDPVAALQDAPFAFAFIDGNHEGDGPQRDTVAVANRCAETACVMFHDLTSPFVARGLAVMRNLGWQVGIYNTSQIMGIAWRGQFEPVRHVMDPAMPLPEPALLADFPMLSVYDDMS